MKQNDGSKREILFNQQKQVRLLVSHIELHSEKIKAEKETVEKWRQLKQIAINWNL